MGALPRPVTVVTVPLGNSKPRGSVDSSVGSTEMSGAFDNLSREKRKFKKVIEVSPWLTDFVTKEERMDEDGLWRLRRWSRSEEGETVCVWMIRESGIVRRGHLSRVVIDLEVECVMSRLLAGMPSCTQQ